MVPFLEICRRATTGPIVAPDDFDMQRFVPNLTKAIAKYGLKAPPKDVVVPWDDDLADRIFLAAKEFLVETGCYCPDTNRVITFTREELDEAIRYAPRACALGEGKEAKAMRPRRPEDPQLPWCHVGGGIPVSSDEIASAVVEGYARIPQADSMSIPALTRIRGMPVQAGAPSEIFAAIQSVRLGRESMRRAGRPGLPIINLLSTSASPMGVLAVTNREYGLRPSDGWLIVSLSELKLDYNVLNKTAAVLSFGGNVGFAAGAIYGGFAGGIIGSAVLNAAYIMAGPLLVGATYHLLYSLHITQSNSTAREVLTSVALGCQAISRNMPFPYFNLGYAAAGTATPQLYDETAARIITDVVSGANIETVHPAKGILLDNYSPLEMRFACEVAHAAAGMTRQQGNEIVKALLARYGPHLEDAPEGSRFQDCYDVDTLEPAPWHYEIYARAKEDLRRLGLPLR
ncbi:MAG: monomethylamine:corrinoid methyltransferase [Firmicutes bacterium]|nr:monomethylamine:corrinoid methyltransferase [Bacillota bacterium]